MLSVIQIGQGVTALWGSKMSLPHYSGQWLIQQLVLLYKLQLVLLYKLWCYKQSHVCHDSATHPSGNNEAHIVTVYLFSPEHLSSSNLVQLPCSQQWGTLTRRSWLASPVQVRRPWLYRQQQQQQQLQLTPTHTHTHTHTDECTNAHQSPYSN